MLIVEKMIKITNLGHSCLLVEYENHSFVIDPYEDDSVPGLKLPRVSANYVFCTHNHHDHCAKELVDIMPTGYKFDYKTITVPHDHHNGKKRGLNNMYLFNIGGLRILHTGDLGCIPNENILKEISGIDVIFAPINGFYTISAQELLEICNIIKPRLIVPLHYYKKENNSGYPDGNQIDIFKDLIDNYLEVNDFSINIDEKLFDFKALIFGKELQEK